MRFVHHLLLAAAACVLLAHCASDAPPAPPASKVEWYVASKEPLTYCPQGHRLPQPGTSEMIGAEYVYLADRSARFHIPRGCMAHREQALELRQQSKSMMQKTGEVTGGMIKKLLSFIVLTASQLPRR